MDKKNKPPSQLREGGFVCYMPASAGVSPKDRKAKLKNGFRNFAAGCLHMAKTSD